MAWTNDIRQGIRILVRKPGFALTAIVTLALGIGTNAAVFSAAYAVLLRPMPYSDPERLVMVWEDASEVGFPRNTPAPANFADWKRQSTVFTDMAATRNRAGNITGEGEPEYVLGRAVTWNLFPLLGTAPLLGRTFTADEDKPDSRVIVLSYGLWQRRFGGDRRLIGRDIELNGAK
jgi:putative ABC transport system permease protein